MLDTLLINGTIVTPDGRYQGNIGITGDQISHIIAPGITPEAKQTVDLSGKFVLPGAIDAHTHIEDPGHTEREDFPHATAAGAVGGITAIGIMPTNDPLIMTKDAYATNAACYIGNGHIDYFIHGGLDGNTFPHARELWKDTGITAIKVFMCFSSPNMGFVDDEILYKTLEMAGEEDALVIAHCENDGIIKLNQKRMEAAGRTDRQSFNQSRPGFGEVEAINRALLFAKETGTRMLIPHVSTADGLLEVRRWRDKGVEVYAESCPQYFTFTNEDFEKQGPYLKFTPVMRDQANQDRMWELIGQDYVDTIGSDHSPYPPEEKEVGRDNIWKALNGIPGLEVELAVFLNAVNAGKLTLEQVVRMTSHNCAHVYRLPRKGAIRVGNDADITVVDMNLEKPYTTADIRSKCTWSPYLGRTFKGWPVMTFVRGNMVAKDGNVVGEKGYGKLVDRAK